MAGLWDQPERDDNVALSEMWTVGEGLAEVERLYPSADHATARTIESHLRAAHRAALLASEQEAKHRPLRMVRA